MKRLEIVGFLLTKLKKKKNEYVIKLQINVLNKKKYRGTAYSCCNLIVKQIYSSFITIVVQKMSIGGLFYFFTELTYRNGHSLSFSYISKPFDTFTIKLYGQLRSIDSTNFLKMLPNEIIKVLGEDEMCLQENITQSKKVFTEN